jgi:hypothetical protein
MQKLKFLIFFEAYLPTPPPPSTIPPTPAAKHRFRSLTVTGAGLCPVSKCYLGNKLMGRGGSISFNRQQHTYCWFSNTGHQDRVLRQGKEPWRE